MGWTYTHKPKGQKILDFFKERWDSEKIEILDCSTVKKVAYMAMRKKDTNEVFALVCLINYSREPMYNFGYKDMDETMGPCYYECPERILNLLTPTTFEYAIEWRKKCRERIEEKKRRGKITKGATVVLNRPVKFSDGCLREKLFVRSARPLRFADSPDGHYLYRVSRSHLDLIGYRVVTA